MSRKTFKGSDAANEAFAMLFNTNAGRTDESAVIETGGISSEELQAEQDPETEPHVVLPHESEITASDSQIPPENTNAGETCAAEEIKPGRGKLQPNRKGFVGYKFMLLPEHYKALKLKTILDPSQDMSGHVRAALDAYLSAELKMLDTVIVP